MIAFTLNRQKRNSWKDKTSSKRCNKSFYATKNINFKKLQEAQVAKAECSTKY